MTRPVSLELKSFPALVMARLTIFFSFDNISASKNLSQLQACLQCYARFRFVIIVR